MRNFDPRFTDLPDYILGITHEIWEDRGISTLRRYYAPDVVVRAPSGVVIGNENVIAATMATLAQYPDRQLLGEDVIWSGSEDEGFLSSHRLMILATHRGDMSARGSEDIRLTYRVIGDCAVRDNVIYDEWVVRDQGAIASQLGTDARSMARQSLELSGERYPAGPQVLRDDGPPATYSGTGNDDEVGIRYESLLNRVMAGELSSIRAEYDRACRLELPGGITSYGWPAAEQFWLGLRSSVPRGEFAIHHRIGMGEPMSFDRAAIRWSLSGTHDGWGRFGPPTGAELHITGISHAEFGPRGLRHEFTVVDDVAIWMQILAGS